MRVEPDTDDYCLRSLVSALLSHKDSVCDQLFGGYHNQVIGRAFGQLESAIGAR